MPLDMPPIYDRYEDLPRQDKPKAWKILIQRHDATKAGPHIDLRLAPKIGGPAYSWAIPLKGKGKWPAPGERALAIEQPTHSWEWMVPELIPKKIPKGEYGAGTVTVLHSGDVQVLEARPDMIKFVLNRNGKTEYYRLQLIDDRGKQRKWLLINYTPPAPSVGLPREKPKMRTVELSEELPDEIANILKSKNWAVLPKLDGIHSYLVIEPGKPIRVFARPRRPGQEPREYTDKFPELLAARAPKDVPPMVIRVEAAAIKKRGRGQFDVYTVNKILHTNDPVEAQRKAEEVGAKLVLFPFDVVSINGQFVEYSMPYQDKLNLLKEVAKKLPEPVLEPVAFTSESKKRELLSGIGKRPLLEEGVVAWRLDAPVEAVKIKKREYRDVYITNVYVKDGRVSAIGYSSKPGGPEEGRVNAATLPKQIRKAMLRNPEEWKGVCIMVSGLGFGSGAAMRHPVIEGIHVEKTMEAGKWHVIEPYKDHLR